VESVEGNSYARTVDLRGDLTRIRVSPRTDRNALQLELELADPGKLMPVVANVRRMFDLDANPAVIAEALGRDPVLSPLLREYPGTRAPGSWSLYESSVRAIVGQQVSIAAARGVCARLAAAASPDCAQRQFPPAQALAGLDDSHFPMPGRRRESLRELARRSRDAATPLDLQQLGEIPGVGPWTVGMVAMRGAADPDILPHTDLGLIRAWESLPGATGKLKDHAAAWSPWRSYAANLLWRSLAL
jgi:AraC family transcriptional regulator of adaptative response / DNA-3-methyladenine glycosylase II